MVLCTKKILSIICGCACFALLILVLILVIVFVLLPKESNKLIGMIDSEESQVSFLVSITGDAKDDHNKSAKMYNGVIVDDTTILTWGHFQDAFKDNIEVSAGVDVGARKVVSLKFSGKQKRKVKSVSIHPCLQKMGMPLALVKLTDALTFDSTVKPALFRSIAGPLRSTSFSISSSDISGWGFEERKDGSTLRRESLIVKPKCQAKGDARTEGVRLCVEKLSDCFYSGAPLIVKEYGRPDPFVAGLLLNALGCKDFEPVFLDLTKLTCWIGGQTAFCSPRNNETDSMLDGNKTCGLDLIDGRLGKYGNEFPKNFTDSLTGGGEGRLPISSIIHFWIGLLVIYSTAY